MPLTRSANSFTPRRARPATPRCRGGASSVLRLAQPAAAQLPTPYDLSGWLSRAADVLLPVTGPLTEWVSRSTIAGAPR